MERLGWESVHSEIDVLSDLYDADIRLSHVRIDLHLREIICDLKNHRRLQTGGNKWPTSTLREMTTPSIGEVIVQ